MNTYQCSNGERVTQAQIDYRERLGKFALLEKQRIEFGYNFCNICKKNKDEMLSVSHNVSKREAKEMGKTELIWDYEKNMEVAHIPCHQVKDGLNLQFSKNGLYSDGKDYSNLESNSEEHPEHRECVTCGNTNVTITDDADICHDCGYVYT